MKEAPGTRPHPGQQGAGCVCTRPASPGLLAQLLIGVVRLYQILLSPLLGPVCRFEPSCSRYAISCLSTEGPLRGSWLALSRFLRCHPWNPGGYDPPPGWNQES